MKKWVSVLLLIFILGITGCGKKPVSSPSDSTETEPVSSSDDSMQAHMEKEENTDSIRSDKPADSSEDKETTKKPSDNELSEGQETQTQTTDGPVQSDNNNSDNIQLADDTAAPPQTDNPPSAPQPTKGHSDDTTTKETEKRTTAAKTVPATDKTQPATTAGEETKPPAPPKEKELINVTISISCMAALNNDELKPGISLPSDGMILNSLSVKINKGSTVYDAFKKACSVSGINYEFTGTELRKNIYISSIAGLSQMDCGQYSGWKYSVNGTESSVGCSMHILSEGDTIDWHYTTTL